MLWRKANLPLEVAILLMAALTMLAAGLLRWPGPASRLPFYANGLYGLVLVMFALQMITLGKTPFGDLRSPRLLLVLGILISSIGIVTCIIPDILGPIPRHLLVLCLGPGALALLLQTLLDPGKFRNWLQIGGLIGLLGPCCGAVYALAMLVALLIGTRTPLESPVSVGAFLGYGLAILILAGVLYRVYAAGLAEEKTGEVELSTEHAMLLLTGIFMLLLGVLLVPVNLGLLAFSASAQLGLLMVIFAVQMLTTGNTPLGPFPRSWLMIALGLAFAAVGIVSCLIPELLTAQLTVFVGALNLLGGAGGLIIRQPSPPRVAAAQITLNVLTLVFGASMLGSHLLPGIVIGVVLALNGCVLLYLLRTLVQLGRPQAPQ